MIYVHVPFCRSFCTYCGFYSEVCRREDAGFEAWADAVCAEISARRDEIAGTLNVNTLYIGGGTPSVLPLSVLGRVVDALSDFGPFEEFTVEINPEDIAEKGVDYIRGLRSLGVSRVSVGVQSFDDRILRRMARRHNSATALSALQLLREEGFGNISLDLISGFPGLTDKMWEATLDEALAFRPEHISAYQLSVESGSALEEALDEGRWQEAPEEQCRRQYERLCKKLRDAGYVHYEISNFALPGYEAVHNSAYWRRIPYVGLGPGAHSLAIVGSGMNGEPGLQTRSWNTEVPAGYEREAEELTPEDIRVESLMLPLRTAAGIGRDELARLASPEKIGILISEGTLEAVGQAIRIPEDHFFVCDDIIRSLI